jgi:hypothetical protein
MKDRKSKTAWISWALILCAVLAANIALIYFAPGSARQTPDASTTDAGPKGAKALYTLLQRDGMKVSRKTTSMRVHPPRDSVLVSLDPAIMFDSEEIYEMKDWLNGGGTFIIGTSNMMVTSPYGITLGDIESGNAPLSPQPEKPAEGKGGNWLLIPVSLSPVSDGVSKIDPASGTTIIKSGADTIPHIRAGAGAVLAERRIGSGRVFVFTCPDIAGNDNLLKADNLRLFINIINAAGTEREIIFDEYHHGSATAEWTGRMGFFKLLVTTPYGLCALLFALAMGFMLLNRDTVGVRRPRPHIEKPSALDHIAAVASLQMRLGAHPYAARRLLDSLHRELHGSLALPPDARLEQALALLAASNANITPETSGAVLAAETKLIAGEPLDARETLRLARAVESIRRELHK